MRLTDASFAWHETFSNFVSQPKEQSCLACFRTKKQSSTKKYAKLLDEAHKLSHVSRRQSDLKAMEADEVLKAIKECEGGTAGH
jgi:hypothetical protein